MKLTACYMRVSTDGQADANGTQSQRAEIERWLVFKQIPPEKVRWYEDVGTGSKTEGRAGFASMVTDARSGALARIVGFKMDRLFRSNADAAAFLDEMMTRKIDVHLLADGLNVTADNPMSTCIAKMVSICAEMERANIIQRVRAGVRRSIEAGNAWGGAREVRKGCKGFKQLTEEEEALVVALRAGGATFAEIGGELDISNDIIRKTLKRAKAVARG